jgi:hypothetical protein
MAKMVGYEKKQGDELGSLCRARRKILKISRRLPKYRIIDKTVLFRIIDEFNLTSE